MEFKFEKLPVTEFDYDYCEPRVAYEVTCGGEVVGKVAHAANEWVARNADGNLWYSYSKTRKGAAAALVSPNSQYQKD